PVRPAPQGKRVLARKATCEVSILVLQMLQRGQRNLLSGLNANYYITGVEVMTSLLRASRAVLYWMRNGCVHINEDGPELVRPCPALNIASWVPNLYGQPGPLTRDGVDAL